jgi:hypothetical protein
MSELGLSPLRDGMLCRRISDHCNAMVAEATGHGDTIRRFPGTMALSLSRRHMQMIAMNDYVALEKSDGVRYMLMALPEYVVLIDRRMIIYIVDPNPIIPSFGNPECLQENTLLDGELTFNMALERWEYLIYDAIAIDGDLNVAKLDFRQRLRAVESYVTAPRVWSPAVSGLLRLRVKDYYEKARMRELFDHIKKDPKGEYIYINHDRRDGVMCNLNDGVIFTPVKLPYVVKNCPALLKWKPPHLNSIDFALQLERAVDARTDTPTVKTFIAYRADNGNCRLREVFFPSKLKRIWAASFDEYHNSIVELSYDRGSGEWRFIRRREDKDTPNFSSTVIDTMESIAESMDREELTTFIERKSAPPPSNAQKLIQEQDMARAVCTFADDLFDADNLAYALTTPISRIPAPFAPPGLASHANGRTNQRGIPSSRPNRPPVSQIREPDLSTGPVRPRRDRKNIAATDGPTAYVDV